MIVSCPRCHKQYRLDASRLRFIEMPGNVGLGVQLACSNCKEQWWEPKKNFSESKPADVYTPTPYKNLTDLSGLVGTQLQTINNSIPSSGFIPSRDDLVSAIGSENTKKPKTWHTVLKVGLWSTLIFSSIIAAGIIFISIETPKTPQESAPSQNTPKASPSDKPSAPTTPPAPTLEPEIKDVQYAVKKTEEGDQRVIVVGEIENPHSSAISLGNLIFTVLAACKEGQQPDRDGLCIAREWPYKWDQKTIEPGQVIKFKGAAKVAPDAIVNQVHARIEPFKN